METKDILIGVAIGLVIAWLFGSRQQAQPAQQPAQTISSQQLFYMQNRIDRIEQFLTSNQQPLIVQQPISLSSPTPVAAPIINAGYKNDEKWIIERGKDGHIKSLQIARDAKVRKLE